MISQSGPVRFGDTFNPPDAEKERISYLDGNNLRKPKRNKCPRIEPKSKEARHKADREASGRYERRSPDWTYFHEQTSREWEAYESILYGQTTRTDQLAEDVFRYLYDEVLIGFDAATGALWPLGEERKKRLTDHPGAPPDTDHRHGKRIPNLAGIVADVLADSKTPMTNRELAELLNKEESRIELGISDCKYVSMPMVREAQKAESDAGAPVTREASKREVRRYGHRDHWIAPTYETTGERPSLRKCGHCGTEMVGARANRVYCSESCKQLAKRARDTDNPHI